MSMQKVDCDSAARTVTLKSNQELVRSQREPLPSRVVKQGELPATQYRSTHASRSTKQVRAAQPQKNVSQDCRRVRSDVKPPQDDRRRSQIHHQSSKEISMPRRTIAPMQ